MVLTGQPRSTEILPAFRLSQNYPNLCSPSTTIRYGPPRQSAIQLAVFNTLNASGLATGVYFYRLSVSLLARRDLVPRKGDGQDGTFSETEKLLLMR